MPDRTADEDFDAFVAAVSSRLLHAADLLTGDRARGEDLVQHGLAVAYVRWSSLRGGHPEAYVRKVMLHRYLDWWRRVRWREQPLLQASEAGRIHPAYDLGAPGQLDADVARRDAVQRALAGLTRRERAVVVLRYWLDLDEAAIAAELGIAPGTVKSTAARALAKLRHDPHLTPDPAPPAAPQGASW